MCTFKMIVIRVVYFRQVTANHVVTVGVLLLGVD